MATSKADIRGWLREARRQGATHLLVVCDTYDWEDYPVYVLPGDKVHDKITYYCTGPMQRVMEVYSMALDDAEQLAERRAWHV